MVEKQQVMKCCVHFWRILFIILNSLFLVIGLALVGLAIYLLATQNDLKILTGSNIGSGAVLILIAGLITAIISFIGVLGAIGMWPALLIVYIVLLFVIVVLEIVAGILGFVFRDDLELASAERAEDAINTYYPTNHPMFDSDVNFIVDFLQDRFTCCGYNGNSDWVGTPFENVTGRFPDSCNCSTTEEDSAEEMDNSCTELGSANQTIYTRPCNATFSQFIRENLIIVGGVGIAFGLFEVIGIIVAIALTCCFCFIKKHEDEYEFTKAV